MLHKYLIVRLGWKIILLYTELIFNQNQMLNVIIFCLSLIQLRVLYLFKQIVNALKIKFHLFKIRLGWELSYRILTFTRSAHCVTLIIADSCDEWPSWRQFSTPLVFFFNEARFLWRIIFKRESSAWCARMSLFYPNFLRVCMINLFENMLEQN